MGKATGQFCILFSVITADYLSTYNPFNNLIRPLFMVKCQFREITGIIPTCPNKKNKKICLRASAVCRERESSTVYKKNTQTVQKAKKLTNLCETVYSQRISKN